MQNRFKRSDFSQEANESISVIVQIEHIKGEENIDDILAVEGVDAAFVGPYDLSGSLGILGQIDHPKMLEEFVAVGEEGDFPILESRG